MGWTPLLLVGSLCVVGKALHVPWPKLGHIIRRGEHEREVQRCGQYTRADLFRPIPEVLAEHPGVDGYCYFSGVEPWIWYTGPIINFEEAGRGANQAMRARTPMSAGACPPDTWYPEGMGPSATAVFDAGVIQTHLDCDYYAYYDQYFFSLGWLKNQRLDGSKMRDPAAWEDLAKKECQRLEDRWHFQPQELTVHKHGSQGDDAMIRQHAHCSITGHCTAVTTRTFALHAYGKCLLGHAAQDMAFGQTYGCLLAGNLIGHETACARS